MVIQQTYEKDSVPFNSHLKYILYTVNKEIFKYAEKSINNLTDFVFKARMLLNKNMSIYSISFIYFKILP